MGTVSVKTLLLLRRFWGRIVQGQDLGTVVSLDPSGLKKGKWGLEERVVTNPTAPPGGVACLVFLSQSPLVWLLTCLWHLRLLGIWESLQ